MAREIPTFRSERVTQIPSMGIVEQSGVRDMAQSLSQRAKLADTVGAFANQKADEFVARKTKIAAENAVREGGLDPATLKYPITMADKIYREAALNTYTIQVEDALTKTIQENSVKYENNPKGFLNASEAYVKGVIGKLAPEMRSSFEQTAMANIRKNHFALSEQLRARAKAEAIAVEDAYIEQQIAGIINTSDPEERAAYLAKIGGTVTNSARFITPEAKGAKMREIDTKIIEGATITDVANKTLTPTDAMRKLKESGIAVDAPMMQRILSASVIKDNYEANLLANEKARREATVTAIETDGYNAALNLEGATEQQAMETMEQSVAKMVMAGADGKEIESFRSSYQNIFLGNTRDNTQVVLRAEQLIYDADPDATNVINFAIKNNAITPKTGFELLKKAEEERGGIQSNSQVKSWEAAHLRNNPAYEYAFLDPVQVDALKSSLDPLDQEKFRKYLQQKESLSYLRAGINQDVNNPDVNKRMSLPQALAKAQGSMVQVDATKPSFTDIDQSNPERNKIYEFATSEDIIIDIPVPSRGGIDYVKSNDLSSVNMSEFEKTQVENIAKQIPKKLTKENAREFMKALAKINARHQTLRPNDPPPYSDDVIKGIGKQYGLD